MKFETSNICDICGKAKGGKHPIDHSECAKKRKALGERKERKAKPIGKKEMNYLVRLHKP